MSIHFKRDGCVTLYSRKDVGNCNSDDLVVSDG
jgi:hypothetical protein